jgi:hypothetical protein
MILSVHNLLHRKPRHAQPGTRKRDLWPWTLPRLGYGFILGRGEYLYARSVDAAECTAGLSFEMKNRISRNLDGESLGRQPCSRFHRLMEHNVRYMQRKSAGSSLALAFTKTYALSTRKLHLTSGDQRPNLPPCDAPEVEGTYSPRSTVNHRADERPTRPIQPI